MTAHTVKFVNGDMVEGGRVTLEIDGKQVTRVVRYNRADGLYVVYQNNKYFEYETDYTDYYRVKDNFREVDVMLTKEQLHRCLDKYYKKYYGERDTDEWYVNPAKNMWKFVRDGKTVLLVCDVKTGKVTEK